MNVLLTGVTVGGMGLVCGSALALAARFLFVKEDPRVAEVTEILPGSNCGGCGYAGCSDYANAIVVDDAAINLCAPGGAETLAALGAALGVEAEAAAKKVALVLCGGSAEHAPRKFLYNGVADCAAAHAVGGGDKLCGYGCLGYASCARVCPVGAIEITSGGHLALVHPALCIGCGACVKACPRDLIQMVPAERTIHVLCRSKDKGPAVKKACKVGCIGCTICTKLAEDEAIAMDGSLAVVDYTKPLDNDQVVEKCPTDCITRREVEA
ncbi:MAG: RnfABCDGE type electron transport complex subunit B [Lentisphaerae bacterium]|nr:RnfABCDGE type electron transport complex subunit B [Lentisphaerota bacterium]